MGPSRPGAAAGRISPLFGGVIAFQAFNMGGVALISLFLYGVPGSAPDWTAPVAAAGAAALLAGGARIVRDHHLGLVLVSAGLALGAIVFAPFALRDDGEVNLYAVGSIGLSLIGLALAAWRPTIRSSA
jgi:hypothetical protein